MRTGQAAPGQRWVSDSEPELGLGIILKAEFGRVEIFFPAANEHRQYALKSAPLRRVQFKEGDQIRSHEGEKLVVEEVIEKGPLFVYRTKTREVSEAELSDTISFSKPEDRLLGGQVDDLETFNLRVEALSRRNRILKAPVRGFMGGRVDLIPHQMYIASEVASRLVPRVLLADEVGLGKTIEAGLILHRLHLTGRANRVLILVPEALIHQWFVELLRRFNLLFSIFDEDRCESIALHNPEANPFLENSLILCSIEFLAGNPERGEQVRDAGWDLLIVDEAHHLEWHPDDPSPQYLLVESVARKTPGLLLLTATPQQLGPEGHFARLRLLDPDRYNFLETFLQEAEHYEQVARAVDRLLEGKPMTKEDRKVFGQKSARILKRCEELSGGDEHARSRLVSELLDEFGTGRVMFRNTRAALTGFPERIAVLAPLDLERNHGATEEKVKWLAKLLKKLKQAKVLLICRTRKLAEQVYELLQAELNVACALFHEDLTLLQRDRNAAFFAEEEGARILICSEIGSEGRNFQFAHHLVMFDLPANPELLEQRIGRLDRIGQTATIQIHVPYIRGTESEVLARWYHEGLNAFEKNPHGANEIAKAFVAELEALHKRFDAKKLEQLIKKSREQHSQVAKKLERGHDRLLELNSCRPEQAGAVIEQIRTLDSDTDFEDFFIRLLDHFGLQIEDDANRSYVFRPGTLLTDAFPSLPEEGLHATFDRARALSREDLGFLSQDHPMIRGALDLLLGSEAGNAAFGVWKAAGGEAIFLEIQAVVECVAPVSLNLDRFLPATAIRILVDHALNDLTEEDPLRNAPLEKGDVVRLLDRGVVKRKLVPAMLEKAQSLAGERMQSLVTDATTTMQSQLQDEIERLETLQQINDHVRPDEVAAARQHKVELEQTLQSARLRLDAVRLVMRVG